MKPVPQDEQRGYDKRSLLKAGALAVALGAATWLLAPVLLPSGLPSDFPKLPDQRRLNPSLRDLLKSVDRQARRHPGSADAMGRLAMAYHANAFMEQAGHAYRIAARLAPGDYEWVYCQAYLEEENGNEEEQARFLRQTLQLKPDHAVALLKLADWSFKHDRLDEAARYYEAAANAPGGKVPLQARFGLGRVAARRRDWNSVIESVAPLCQAYPYLRPPHDLLQQAHEMLGHAEQAAEAKRGAALARLKIVPPPDDPLSEQLNGLCYSSTRLLKQAGLLSRTGKPDQAIQAARRAADAEPADADVRYFIAHTLLTSNGDKPEAIDEAVTQLGECLRLRTGDLSPLWNFASDFFMAPRTSRAVERLDALLQQHASSGDAHLSLGMAAEAKGQTTEAVSQYEAALRNNPNDAVAHNKLGQLFDRAGRYGEAVEHFQKSVQLDPLNAALRRNFGIGLVQQENFGQAVKEFSEVLRINPYDAPSLLSMGFAYLNLKRLDEAIPKFREALRCQPNSAEGHFGLGFALSARGRREEALPELREAVRLRPDFPEAQALLGQLGQ
jgi:tetratricopeptide (TPR) repeat protein